MRSVLFVSDLMLPLIRQEVPVHGLEVHNQAAGSSFCWKAGRWGLSSGGPMSSHRLRALSLWKRKRRFTGLYRLLFLEVNNKHLHIPPQPCNGPSSAEL